MSELERARTELADRDLDVRCAGVERLARVAGPEAAEALAELLSESSWYLRDRVVRALVARPDGRGAVLRVLAGGSWFARASACEVLAQLSGEGTIEPLFAAVEDRNVSLQKAAAAALRSLGERDGAAAVAGPLARLPLERQRRILTRLAHQEPHWVGELEARVRAPSDPPGGAAPPPAFSSGRDELRALSRFRRWVVALGPEEEA